MGTWGTSLKDNDTFADIYDEFFDLYNKGEKVDVISKKLVDDNQDTLGIEEEENNFWFALALAQWETKSLDPKILKIVEQIISSGSGLRTWSDLGASDDDIKKRKITLDKFLLKLKTDRPKAKPRKKAKIKTPIFSKGDCLTFQLKNGSYGGAVVLETDPNPETACNLVATTRLNLTKIPKVSDFERAEVLVCNFGQWQDKPEIIWHMPDFFYKSYSGTLTVVGRLDVEFKYDPKNHDDNEHGFRPSWTAAWNLGRMVDLQLESEQTKSRPEKKIFIKQLTKKAIKLW